MQKSEHHAYLSEGDCENGVGSTADVIHQSRCSCPENKTHLLWSTGSYMWT